MEVSHSVAHALVRETPATTSTTSLISVLRTQLGIEVGSEPDERTPLLNRADSESSSLTAQSSYPKECINWRTIGLLVMFILALSLATYLLYQETHIPDMGYKLSLIRHDIWSRANLQGQPLLEADKVINVFITHTASAECFEDCADLLQTLQIGHLEELPFNFLIAGDCETYEARGWKYASSLATLPQAESLVFAFVGDFSKKLPSKCQLHIAQSLLWESLRRLKLQPNYRLYLLRNVTRSLGDAEALQHRLKHWSYYAGQRNV